MSATRACENCSEPFTPRREHGRFCSSRCRVAWNRGTMHYPAGEGSALDWSIAAMVETVERLRRVRAWDAARAAALIGEAVWWVTIVDWTMVRYHPETYDAVLAGAAGADRAAIEESLAGLRYVRNNMGHHIDHVDFVAGPARQRGQAPGPLADWTWRALPHPSLSTLSPAAAEWEMDRYRAYQGRLAGRAVGESFCTARQFLADVAATAEADTRDAQAG